MLERTGPARLLGACSNGGWPVVLRRMGLMRRIFDMFTSCLRSVICCLVGRLVGWFSVCGYGLRARKGFY